MPRKKEISKQDIVDTALALAAERGWEQTTFSAIAQRAEVSLAALYDLFDDKTQILAEYERGLNRRVLESVGEPEEGVSVRDRLFDLLMERFEILNENRDALISILHSFRFDPKQAVIGLPHLAGSMSWMLEAAGADTSGYRGAAKVTGLTGLYLKVLRCWARDEGEDLAKTMAVLDKSLDRAERAANSLGLV